MGETGLRGWRVGRGHAGYNPRAMSELRPIVILGPTAGGKSELAVQLAERLSGEVIGADSMQVYRQLDAGTAKPEPALRARAVHHLIDIVEPTEPFTVADWLTRADGLIAELAGRGRRAIVVGGTNLYLKALLVGMFDGPPADMAYRASLDAIGTGELHTRLKSVDPAAGERISPNDRKRIVRALEVFETTGTTISEQQQEWAQEPAVYRHNPVLIGLNWPTETINRRINARVKQMFEPAEGVESLPDETARLLSAGLLGLQAREALGYKQVIAHMAGEMTLDEAFERTKILTRRFAKQQRTWLRRFRVIGWIDAGETGPETWADLAERQL